jgi:putative ABC transport system permease protein
MEALRQDLHYAARTLWRNPGFAAALVLTLGLGIGASTAMFSVVDALLLRPLPYGEPDELVQVWPVSPESRRELRYIAWEEARAWSERADFFDGALLHARGSVLYVGGAGPRTLTIEAVSPNFEEVLRVQPTLGRGFAEADAEPGAEPVVVLNHGFWRTAFGADPGVIDQRIELDGIRHRIIGVMPPGFKFPEYAKTEVWLPIHRDGTILGEEAGRVEVLGRVGPGGPEVARAHAEAFAAVLAVEMGGEAGWSARLMTMEEMRARNSDLHRAVWFLSGAVALILLVAAVNAVSLLLVRGWSRTRELAVRTALGASRRRLIGQFLTESVLLALLSGAVAVVLALFVLEGMRGIMPGSITFFAPYAIEIEQRTLGFTFAVAAAAGLLVGLIPAIQATRRSTAIAAAGLTPYAARTPAKSRLRRSLVVGAVALSVMLLVGAGLLINSFARLTSVDPGYRVEELAIMNLSLSSSGYPSAEERGLFLQRLEERLETVPGVEGVTVPSGGISFGVALQAEGQAPPAEGQPIIIPHSSVTPDYFGVLEIPIRAGRAFTEDDAETDNVIIDEDLARFLWSGTNPVGRRFRLGADSDWLTVVGVISDLKLEGPDDRRGDYEFLYPHSLGQASSYVSLAIRTRGDPAPLFPSIRSAVYELDPEQPISELRPATDVYAETIDMERFLLVLMSVLSGLALLLAAIGIHGVLAFTVAQRRHDLGIRIALGARPEALARGVLGEGLALAAVGVGLGIAGAVAISGLVRSLLFGVEPTDPVTITAVVIVSLTTSALASYWPARRATRVDPAEVLKAE